MTGLSQSQIGDALTFLGDPNSGGFLQSANNTFNSITDPVSGAVATETQTLQNRKHAGSDRDYERSGETDSDADQSCRQQMAQANALIASLQSQTTSCKVSSRPIRATTPMPPQSDNLALRACVPRCWPSDHEKAERVWPSNTPMRLAPALDAAPGLGSAPYRLFPNNPWNCSRWVRDMTIMQQALAAQHLAVVEKASRYQTARALYLRSAAFEARLRPDRRDLNAGRHV